MAELSLPAAASARADAGVPLERIGVMPWDRAGVLAFTAVFAGTALGAYSLGPIPIQWLTQFGLLGVAGCLLLANRLPRFPGLGLLAVLTGWAAVVTLGNLMLRDYPVLMPPQATAPYPVYMALRFLNLLAFAAAVGLTFWLLRLGHRETLVRRVVWIGTLAALAGVYIYFAQVQGWWEPGRSRTGTDGGEQTTLFAYAFHRAMGTFREPSHFAEWLVLPFFLSFAHRGRGKHLHTGAMAAALLLTGSLTGILAIVGGLTGALALGNPFRGGRLKVPLRLAVAAGVGLVLFNAVAVGNSAGETADLFKVLTTRIEPILEGGLGQSNRYYVYDYVASQPIPLLGSGLGHAQMHFSLAHGATVITSFLSLYLNTLFSLGVPGLAMLLLLLGFPVVGLARQRRYGTRPELMPLMAAYLGWLVMFVVHSEELSLVFGVLFALMVWEGTAQARAAEDAAA
jgi:hypothetical protein